MLGDFVISLVLSRHSKNLRQQTEEWYSSVLFGKQRKIHPGGLRVGRPRRHEEERGLRLHFGSSVYMFFLPPAAAAAKSLQLCPTLCDPIDSSPPDSSVLGILQARILEWVAISFSNACMHAKLLQSHPTLCDPTDSSPPGSSVRRILQARILEWVAISCSPPPEPALCKLG